MIEVDNLAFSYSGATAPTLDGLSFSISSGEVYGLLAKDCLSCSRRQMDHVVMCICRRRYYDGVDIGGVNYGRHVAHFYSEALPACPRSFRRSVRNRNEPGVGDALNGTGMDLPNSSTAQNSKSDHCEGGSPATKQQKFSAPETPSAPTLSSNGVLRQC